MGAERVGRFFKALGALGSEYRERSSSTVIDVAGTGADWTVYLEHPRDEVCVYYHPGSSDILGLREMAFKKICWGGYIPIDNPEIAAEKFCAQIKQMQDLWPAIQEVEKKYGPSVRQALEQARWDVFGE